MNELKRNLWKFCSANPEYFNNIPHSSSSKSMDIICHLNGSLITTHIPGSGYYIKIQALRVNGELILNTSLKQDPTSANIVIRIQNINGHISNHVFQGIHDSFHVDLNAGVVGVPCKML